MGVENAATGQSRSDDDMGLSELAHTTKLPDGRTLGYAEYGPEDAPALFLFHGLPGSRLAVEELWPGSSTTGTGSGASGGAVPNAVATDSSPGQVRVIAPDRPGMGLSDFQPGRRIGAWAADVAALADALGLSRFAVAGYSGGGPHALAVAHALPDRMVAVRCIAGGGQFDGSVSAFPVTAIGVPGSPCRGEPGSIALIVVTFRHMPEPSAQCGSAGFSF